MGLLVNGVVHCFLFSEGSLKGGGMNIENLLSGVLGGLFGSLVTVVYSYNTAKIKVKREVAIEIIEYLESLEDAKTQMLSKADDEEVWTAGDNINYLLWKKSPLLKVELVFGEKTKNATAEIIEKFREYKEKVLAATRIRLITPGSGLSKEDIADQRIILCADATKMFEQIDLMINELISGLKRKCSLETPENHRCDSR